MSNKSLLETNPHLKDAQKYLDALITNVSSSTAIETGDIITSISQNISETTRQAIAYPPQQKKASSQ